MMYKVFCCLLIGTFGVAFGDGIKALNSFLQTKNNSISADFTQTVVGNKKVKVTTGTMEIERPNKFRWYYVKEEQTILGDGINIYIYDKPLQQVTQNKLGGFLGKSPALILAGGSDIKKYYTVTANPESDNLEWITLTPKNSDENNGFKSVQIGFDKISHLLARMKFVYTFDNKSTIDFNNVRVGIKYPKNEFNFIVPKNVDVIKAD